VSLIWSIDDCNRSCTTLLAGSAFPAVPNIGRLILFDLRYSCFFRVSITVGRISQLLLSKLNCIQFNSCKRNDHYVGATCLNIKITLHFADRVHLWVSYDYLNKYQLFSLIALYSSVTFLEVCRGRKETTKYNILGPLVLGLISD
jgi:hypothetical protein